MSAECLMMQALLKVLAEDIPAAAAAVSALADHCATAVAAAHGAGMFADHGGGGSDGGQEWRWDSVGLSGLAAAAADGAGAVAPGLAAFVDACADGDRSAPGPYRPA